MNDLMQPNQRQSGAAQVPVLFFLFLLILFLGAAFFAYSKADENSKLRQRISEVEAANELNVAKTQILADYTKSLADTFGAEFNGTYTGRANRAYGTAGQDDLNIADFQIEGAPLGDKLKQGIEAFVSAPEMSGVTYKGSMTTLFDDIKAKIRTTEEATATAEAARVSEQDRATKLEQQNQTTRSEMSSEIAKLNSDKQKEVDDLTRRIEARGEDLDRANQQYRDIRAKMTEDAAAHQEQIAAMTTKLETMQGRVDAMSQRVSLINPPESADGVVLSASDTARRAWINLGQKDMLPAGTSFTIVDPIDGREKGAGKVIAVEWNRAELSLTKINDKFDPIRADDQVRNDLYSPNLRRNIYLMGRFVPPFTRPVVKQQLEALGNTVVDELTPAVDLVLVGKGAINPEGSGFTPLTDTDEFKFASFLRLEMRPVSKVRQFLTAPSSR